MRKLLLTLIAAAALAAAVAATAVARVVLPPAGHPGGLAAARAASAASPPTGNAIAIAFARSIQRSYDHVPAISYTQRGYVVMSDRRTAPSFFEWRWGLGRFTGMNRATESAVVRLRRGRVVWVLDTLTARHSTPVQIFVGRSGQFWRFAGRRHLGCFAQLSGTVPWRVHALWITVDGGHFLRLVHRGGNVLSRFTFAWSTDQTALETDTVSPLSRLILSYTISVPRGAQPGEPGFRFSATYDNLTTAPAAPRVRRCG